MTGTNYTASQYCAFRNSDAADGPFSPYNNGWSEYDVAYFMRINSDSPFYMDTSIEITDDTWKRWRLKAKIHAYRAKWGKDPYTGRILTTEERICEVSLADMWKCWLK